VAPRARRNPPAERRKLEGLWKVAKGQPLLGKLCLQSGPGRAGLDAGRQGAPLDFDDAVEAPEVEAQHGAVAIVHVALDTADHTRPTAKWNDRDLCVARPVEHSGDVRFGSGRCDEVGRRGEVPTKATEDVAIALAVRMPDPRLVLIGHEAPEDRWRARSRRA
jgi:hypothetical protein